MNTPADAASVVLLRDHRDPFQVYMLHRHRGHKFMADVWVFPGGKVDDADRRGDADTTGLRVAAVRETFEEARILLARNTAQRLDDLAELRHRLNAGEVTFRQLLENHQLEPAVDDLVFFAHWITPEFESHRYDTRFFAVEAPPDQTARHDDGETTGGAWLTPRQAIEHYRNEEIELAPPTLRILERLDEFNGVDEALHRLRAEGTPTTIEPRLDEEASEPTLILHDDPDAAPGGVTRMVLRDGQWFSG